MMILPSETGDGSSFYSCSLAGMKRLASLLCELDPELSLVGHLLKSHCIFIMLGIFTYHFTNYSSNLIVCIPET